MRFSALSLQPTGIKSFQYGAKGITPTRLAVLIPGNRYTLMAERQSLFAGLNINIAPIKLRKQPVDVGFELADGFRGWQRKTFRQRLPIWRKKGWLSASPRFSPCHQPSPTAGQTNRPAFAAVENKTAVKD
jgi:hypothetical protein